MESLDPWRRSPGNVGELGVVLVPLSFLGFWFNCYLPLILFLNVGPFFCFLCFLVNIACYLVEVHWVINGFISCILVKNNCYIITIVWFISFCSCREILLIFGEGFQGVSPSFIFAIWMYLFYTIQSYIWTTLYLYGF